MRSNTVREAQKIAEDHSRRRINELRNVRKYCEDQLRDEINRLNWIKHTNYLLDLEDKENGRED